MVANKKPVGVITRGTTNPNRLRRVDRYITNQAILKQTKEPLLVDLGFGAYPRTAIELLERASAINPTTRLLGIEIDPERIRVAQPFATNDLLFQLGGFEIPIPQTLNKTKVTLIRAMNVLRQYDESDVQAAWSLMQSRLEDGGLIVEGTCDEIGRLATWVTLDNSKVLSLTFSFRLLGLQTPSKIAERLPKVLIHHNVEGESINKFLTELDAAWASHSGLSVFSPVQRFSACAKDLLNSGWPITNTPKRWRLGELTVDWDAVKPRVVLL